MVLHVGRTHIRGEAEIFELRELYMMEAVKRDMFSLEVLKLSSGRWALLGLSLLSHSRTEEMVVFLLY